MKSFIFFFVFSVILISAVHSLNGDLPFTRCSDFTPDITIKTVKIAPYPNSAAQPFNLNLNGELNSTVQQGATVTTSFKAGIFEIFQNQQDLCSDMLYSITNTNHTTPHNNTHEKSQQHKCKCPCSQNNLTISIPFNIPDIQPFVRILVHIVANNADGSGLFCLDTSTSFSQ